MADNVPITAGSGTSIATDDVGGVHYQVVKQAFGVLDSATLVSATNPLPVTTDASRAEDSAHSSGHIGLFTLSVANEAGTAFGADGDYTPTATDTRGVVDVNVRQPQKWFEVDVPGVAATSHTAGDQYGTLITVTNAARSAGFGGFITSIQLFDDSDAMGAFDVVFFNDTPTLAADDAAYAVSDAHNRFTVAVAPITYALDMGANRFGQLAGVSIPYFCTGTSLFVALITRTTFTAVASAVRFRVSLIRD